MLLPPDKSVLIIIINLTAGLDALRDLARVASRKALPSFTRIPFGRNNSQVCWSNCDQFFHRLILTILFKGRARADYRHFDQADISPRYEFGFDLSYTTFSLSGLDVSVKSKKSGHGAYPSGYGSTAIPPPGGHSEPWDTIASVSVKVKDTGSLAGAAVS